MKSSRRRPEIILKNGKPSAVILKMREYERLLERLEDADDLRWLRQARRKPLHFRKLEEVLSETARV